MTFSMSFCEVFESIQFVADSDRPNGVACLNAAAEAVTSMFTFDAGQNCPVLACLETRLSITNWQVKAYGTSI
jgi:hypothetical protein